MPSASPCPYPPDFLAAQRARLLAARLRLRAQLPVGQPAGPKPSAPMVRDLAREGNAPLSAADRAGALAGRPFALAPAALRGELAQSAASALSAVEGALARLATGHYGWDAAAGRWIPTARLRALPSAAACLPQDEVLP